MIVINARSGPFSEYQRMKHIFHMAGIGLLLVAFAVLAVRPVQADIESPEADLPPANFLTENTLIYPDRDGEENLIHFGRFGNFDWYYPCTFESGLWTLDADNVLSLTYDNRKLPDRSYRLSRAGESVLMIEPDRTTQASLTVGNKLPYT